jgi:hypothetical protein
MLLSVRVQARPRQQRRHQPFPRRREARAARVNCRTSRHRPTRSIPSLHRPPGRTPLPIRPPPRGRGDGLRFPRAQPERASPTSPRGGSRAEALQQPWRAGR